MHVLAVVHEVERVVVGDVALAEPAEVRRDDLEARSGKRTHIAPPNSLGLRIAVEQHERVPPHPFVEIRRRELAPRLGKSGLIGVERGRDLHRTVLPVVTHRRRLATGGCGWSVSGLPTSGTAYRGPWVFPGRDSHPLAALRLSLGPLFRAVPVSRTRRRSGWDGVRR